MNLVETIKQVGIFIVCAQALVHFRPNQAYEKYMKLLVGIMVLIQLVAPFARLFQGKEGTAIQDTILSYQEIMQAELDNINITTVMAEERIQAATLEEIKSRLNNEKTEESNEGIIGVEVEIGRIEVTINE